MHSMEAPMTVAVREFFCRRVSEGHFMGYLSLRSVSQLSR